MSTIFDTTEDCEPTDLEEIGKRHRKERKEFQAKIQALKKTAPKSDKKKRKEIMDEITRMESELNERHTAEIRNAQTVVTSADIPSNVLNENGNIGLHIEPDYLHSNKVSKAQKRRDKKEREARDREEQIKSSVGAASNTAKIIETTKIFDKLKLKKLFLYNISSDGDCLYNAVRHQLEEHCLKTYSVHELREKTANYIIANKEYLISYMTNSSTGDLLTDDEFIKYCEDVRSTSSWGGEIELKALSSILNVRIEVLQSEGPATIHGDENSAPTLTVTYHRHMYSLGEHYNSTSQLSTISD